MFRKIKAISLLLSFMMVFAHMMMPHHHHESLTEIKKTHHENATHAHHHGSQHHHHDHDNQNSDDKESNEEKVPQHFHLSTSDNFEPLRVDHVAREINGQAPPAIAIVNLFSWVPNDSCDYLNYPDIWPEKTAKSQNNPAANGLRAPPSIA